jgi:prepilin-type N-terminal cleavage/methylation domain-containing protein
MSQRSKRHDNQRKAGNRNTVTGFTMVEVIVAVALLSTTIVAAFGAMRTCSIAAHHARMLSRSVLLAETLFAEVSLSQNPAYETREGRDDTYWWQVRIVQTPVENLAAVHVAVKWEEQQREQQYELFSLIHMKTSIEGK